MLTDNDMLIYVAWKCNNHHHHQQPINDNHHQPINGKHHHQLLMNVSFPDPANMSQVLTPPQSSVEAYFSDPYASRKMSFVSIFMILFYFNIFICLC